MMLRLACAQVAAAAKEVVQIIYDAAGASSVYEANGIQQCSRDIYAAVQHLQAQTINFRWFGQLAMGLQPRNHPLLTFNPVYVQAPRPHAMPLRSKVVNASVSHAPRNTDGVVSDGSPVRPPRLAGLWQCPSAK